MRRILLLLLGAAIFALPAAAAAQPHSPTARGLLVVRDGSADGGITGSPVATVVVQGFVVGRIATEGVVQMYHFGGEVTGQATGAHDRRTVYWHGNQGTEFSGSRFRFRAVGGIWRVVVFGAHVSLYAGGVKHVTLHGSITEPHEDGEYSLDGRPFVSLPSPPPAGGQVK